MKTREQVEKEACEEAKSKLQQTGWSQRHVAEHLGYCYQHINLVLNRHRIFSRTLIDKIMALPKCPNPRKCGTKRKTKAGQ